MIVIIMIIIMLFKVGKLVHIFATSIPATLFCTLMNVELLINPGCLHYSFCKSLSPGSRKEYDEFSPHSKTTFKKVAITVST